MIKCTISNVLKKAVLDVKNRRMNQKDVNMRTWT